MLLPVSHSEKKIHVISDMMQENVISFLHLFVYREKRQCVACACMHVHMENVHQEKIEHP